MINLHSKKVLCHRAEVAKDYAADCVFCNVIGGGKTLPRK